MKTVQELIRESEMQKRKPCNKCDKIDGCLYYNLRCAKYAMWFAGEWHRIQRMFKK